jgi:hypothetical protein
MRLKVIIPILLLAIATLVVIQQIRPGPGNDTTLHDSGNSVVILTTNAVTEANADVKGIDAKDPSPERPTGLSTSEESHQDYVSRRTAELMDLAMSDDPASLNSILSELNNPDAEIRDAAVIAAVQFKSADAIPALQEAYLRADDPEEKLSIRKAVEFLEPASPPKSVSIAN